KMSQRDRVQRLELAQLFRIGRVRRLAIRNRERRLPGARPDPEGRLEPGIAPLAEHRRACESLVGDPVPTEADLVARAERFETHEARDLGRETDRRELPAIAAELVDSEGRHDLLDAF